MKLKRFKKENDVKNIKYMSIAFIIILCAVIIFVISKSFAFYKTENHYDVVKSKITNWLTARNLTYDNSSSGTSCTDIECALDELYGTTWFDSIAVGDYIKMTPTATSYSFDTSISGFSYDDDIDPSELKLWRVIKKNDDKTIEVISEYVSSKYVRFVMEGYKSYIDALNQVADQYKNTNYTVSTRYFGYNGQTGTIASIPAFDNYDDKAPWTATTSNNDNESSGGGDVNYENDYNLVVSALGTAKAYINGTSNYGSYWMASRAFVYESENNWYFSGREIDENGNPNYSYGNLLNYTGRLQWITNYGYVRPILTLRTDVRPSGGNGKSAAKAWKLD